jgi:uncharacterized repeat protein (TIGR03803 family)
MKKRFPMRAGGERSGQCSRSSHSPEKLWALCIALVFCISAVVASPAQTLTPLTSFNGANGANPDLMSLVQGSDGTFYGTTQNGGVNNSGTVFSITPAGSLTVLHNFGGGGTDGSFPLAGLLQGADGNFYGTTSSGGTNNDGTIFKVTPAGSVSTLYSFTGGEDGANPYAPLVQDTNGNFYGTTQAGGDDFFGTVFEFSSTGSLTPLHNFVGGTDGSAPYAGLVLAADGNLYGTSSGSGDESPGTVFRVTTAGSFTTIYNFCPSGGSCPNGQIPYARLVQATDGSFYGTTTAGGSGNHGTVFRVTSTGSLTTLWTFCMQGGCPDGANPYAGLIQAADGNFYGTTKVGGNTNNAGTIFQITSAGALTTLYKFCAQSGCQDGEFPVGGLIQGSDGKFYGTTFQGGTSNDGTVFNLSASSYTLTVSVSGSGTVTSTDGVVNCSSVCSYVYPANAPVTLNATQASGWNFSGWSGACSGTGSCSITMTQNMSATATFTQQTYQLTVLTSGSGTVASVDGGINCPGTCANSYPAGTPVTLNAMQAPGWSFTGWGGACSGTGSCTVVMSQAQSVTATFTQNPNFFNLTVSVSGNGTVTSTDGDIICPGTCSHTYAGNTQVTLNASPSLGSTFTAWSGGGCSGTGSCTVTMTQNLSVTATFTGQQDMVTHSFGNGSDGKNPVAALVSDSAGNLYGTTSTNGLYGKGTVFKLSTDGTETILHNFGNSNDGQTPLGNLIFDAVGNLYGTTSAGGVYGHGTAFELSPNGTETVLYSFGNGGDGQNPAAGLVFDHSGNLYGTTVNGGSFGGGTAFELSPSNGRCCRESPVYSFGNGDDGRNPEAGLVFDSAGNLYGTTANGGPNSGGTIFELSPSNGRCCRESPVYIFGGSGDGKNPYAGVVLDDAGNLYGTTVNGGANGSGTAFEVSPNGGGGWTEAFLHSFGSGSDGQNPYAGLVFDTSGNGNLYGTTANGGLYSKGMVFELSQFTNRCCRENPVYDFGFSANDGQHPQASLVIASGTLYGTTVNGGSFGGGTVFGIMPVAQPTASQFVTLTPCRAVDTRNANGPFGGPAISGGHSRDFPLSESDNLCGIPSTAVAYSLNVTVIPEGTLHYLTIWPTGQGQPTVSLMNSLDGRVKANAAIVPAGATNGSVSVYVTDTTNVVLDIDGYFTAPSDSTLAFYPLTPCRVVDTRNPNGNLGGPFLTGGQERDFSVLESSCIPSGISPSAYSFNVTAVPHPSGQRLGYLSVWPAGQQQPVVSTLNNPTGTNVANGAIVPAGTSGAIAVYPTNDTDLLIDINGYFAGQSSSGLSLYTLAPCRVIDTRNVGNGQPFQGERTVNAAFSACAPSSSAQAYVFNATVVPPGGLGYLTLWPDGENQPLVSTLNAVDGSITSNMAIVPTNNGSIDAYASALTQLILDISSYFAP